MFGLKTYFIYIAVVRSAASLLGQDLIDNYALYGTTPRYNHVQLDNIKETDGIDHVPGKAESFIFGTLCNKILNQYLSSFDDEQLLFCEACVGREFFTNLSDEKIEQYSPSQLKSTFMTIFSALIKRAQIRTHTTKPGYEDINSWLERYHHLQQDCADFLPGFVDVLLYPDQVLEKKHTAGFFNREDALLKLVLGDEPIGSETLLSAMAEDPSSIFAKMLWDIVTMVQDKTRIEM